MIAGPGGVIHDASDKHGEHGRLFVAKDRAELSASLPEKFVRDALELFLTERARRAQFGRKRRSPGRVSGDALGEITPTCFSPLRDELPPADRRAPQAMGLSAVSKGVLTGCPYRFFTQPSTQPLAAFSVIRAGGVRGGFLGDFFELLLWPYLENEVARERIKELAQFFHARIGAAFFVSRVRVGRVASHLLCNLIER